MPVLLIVTRASRSSTWMPARTNSVTSSNIRSQSCGLVVSMSATRTKFRGAANTFSGTPSGRSSRNKDGSGFPSSRRKLGVIGMSLRVMMMSSSVRSATKFSSSSQALMSTVTMFTSAPKAAWNWDGSNGTPSVPVRPAGPLAPPLALANSLNARFGSTGVNSSAKARSTTH